MRLLFISGNDTGVGKTCATAALAAYLSRSGNTVRVVKPVQTGVAPDEPTDADLAVRGLDATRVSAHTLRRYQAALAPLAAAEAEGAAYAVAALLAEIRALPPADFVLVEGAGGLAVPLDREGRDWADFALDLGAEATVLVIEDRLGAINQARLTAAYAAARGLAAGLWLNEVRPQDATVRAANREGIKTACAPLWAEQRAGGEPGFSPTSPWVVAP